MISVIALIVAVGGGTSAIAASATKKDNKKDNKIANAVVTARAGGLSVLNSKQLGGKPASAYQPAGTYLVGPLVEVNSAATTEANGTNNAVFAGCPSGYHAVGGGGFGGGTTAPMTSNGPIPGPAVPGSIPTAWQVSYFNNTGGNISVTASVVCAKP